MNIPTPVSRFAGKATLLGKQHAPDILMSVGVVGVVVTAVMVAKATLKAQPVFQEIKNDADDARGRADLNDQEINKDVAHVYIHGGLKLAKIYSPAITTGLASITCIVSSHGIMRRRNVAMAAAYKALETSFSEYRKRVEEELGDDDRKADELRTGVDDSYDESKPKVNKHDDPNKYSVYSKFFDEMNMNWVRNAEHNLIFLKSQQNYWNDVLVSRGHVFLNEVYDGLGMDRTKAGQVVGWVLNEDGDNYIDFGIYNLNNYKSREFVNGRERSILLDFNVDGPVYTFLKD